VRRRHGGDLDDGEGQFRVDLLLKEMTGLDVEDLSLRIKSLQIKRRDRAVLRGDNGDQDPLADVSGTERMLSSAPSLSRSALNSYEDAEPNFMGRFPLSLNHCSIGLSCGPTRPQTGPRIPPYQQFLWHQREHWQRQQR